MRTNGSLIARGIVGSGALVLMLACPRPQPSSAIPAKREACEDQCRHGATECRQGRSRSCTLSDGACARWSEPQACPGRECMSDTLCADVRCDGGVRSFCEQSTTEGCVSWRRLDRCAWGMCFDASQCAQVDTWQVHDELIMEAGAAAFDEAGHLWLAGRVRERRGNAIEERDLFVAHLDESLRFQRLHTTDRFGDFAVGPGGAFFVANPNRPFFKVDIWVMRRLVSQLDVTSTWQGPAPLLVESMAAGSDGRLYVAGYRPDGRNERVLLALDAEGEVAWERTWPGKHGAATLEVAATTEGCVVGATSPIPDRPDGVMLAHFDRNGEELWRTRWGSSQADYLMAIAVRENGYAVAGTTMGHMVDVWKHGASDGFVTMIGLDGERRWTQQWGGPGYDEVRSILAHTNGSMIVLGSHEGDAFCLRLTDDGILANQASWGTDEAESVTAAAVDRRQRVWVIGTTESVSESSGTGRADMFVSVVGPVDDPDAAPLRNATRTDAWHPRAAPGFASARTTARN
jgi:outer membrane protein assembly factor BamB